MIFFCLDLATTFCFVLLKKRTYHSFVNICAGTCYLYDPDCLGEGFHIDALDAYLICCEGYRGLSFLQSGVSIEYCQPW